MYKSLNNKELSKEYLQKSLESDTKSNYLEGVIEDNIDLARLTDEKYYLDEALRLSRQAISEKIFYRQKGCCMDIMYQS